MQNLTDINVVRDVLSRHGFTFSKALGQNFLINPSVCPQMAECCGADGQGVLEIGPGIGVLTAELAKRAQKVVSLELDKRLLPVLAETLADFDNVTIVNDDVLKVDLRALLEEHFAGMEVCVCANLPYYITSPVIMRLLEERLPFCSITVMVQKEAADRLCAPVGSREAGAVTVAVQYYARAEKLFSVSRGSFLPAPNVDSAVIRLQIRETPAVAVADERKFFRMVKAAFGQRRKTALNAISAGMALQKADVASALERAGLLANIRAEQLSMEELAALCEALPG
ncbi:MAG: 16S rRNA (adenine(1518)-N(6)/adenine(1519)-N(6))-dimethyltransferase RsmA [Candidatus Fimivicinus sp.]|nr:16S rRNA (adenine(1518)-N(6)/adenine(1519)-N(6))-dimethyltransferase RsmA [Oscillospiraceae bacterium]MDY5591245.1 16S rRNA (adenine(1518)-N(6)/adenine(1519)-N(6))-dimethyltransferase RsmA [Candidatus Fimivicinus sp.]